MTDKSVHGERNFIPRWNKKIKKKKILTNNSLFWHKNSHKNTHWQIVQYFSAHSWLYFLIKQKATEPDGKEKTKNGEGKELSDVTSEQVPMGRSKNAEF